MTVPAPHTAPVRQAVIDESAIAANVRTLKAGTSADELIAVVKANGYGHGALRSARAALAGGADRVATADLGEALALREAGIEARMMCWLHGAETDFAAAVAANIEVGVSSLDQVRRAADAATSERPAHVHIKLETGLGRNGAPPQEWSDIFTEVAREQAAGRIHLAGVFSHLSGASEAEDLAQADRFDAGLAQALTYDLRPDIRHLASSAAAIRTPRAHYDAVRCGLAIYGLSPFSDASSADLGLRPAMTLRSEVVAVRRVPAGQGVSYGYTYRAPVETTLALVPLGYFDGLPRQASGRGPVVVNGRRATVSGVIAMDQIIIDMGDHPVAVGDEAIIFGDPATNAPSADEWAEAAGTINWEIVTRIGPRVERVDA